MAGLPSIGERRSDAAVNPYLLIAGAGLLAGTMNALAGGGTFVTLPALIAVGIPSIQANASSTVGLVPGSAASAWAYRDGLGAVGTVPLRWLVWVSVIGGIGGALLLLWTPTRMFDRLLPWLLALATLALIFGRPLGERLRRRVHIKPGAVLCLQFALGVYGGYFGGAVGIMTLAVWGLLDDRDFKSMNASRTLVVMAMNLMAVFIFVFAGMVRWRETGVLLVAGMVGGYFGAQLGKRASAALIRAGTLIVAAGITLLFFVRMRWNVS